MCRGEPQRVGDLPGGEVGAGRVEDLALANQIVERAQAFAHVRPIVEVVKKLNGVIDGDKAMGVLKGMKLTSPRGPLSIDPETRDVVQTVYVRRVEKVGDALFNTEFDQIPAVKDPGK